ncbi:hypothetical protein NQU47_10270 [Pseudoalteromonas distincta]|uniref:hypothetical protein n=1 Tax=Pseudoalteromonas distincta TaxID=77608 RepID=UPI0023400C56|nr:hypothetical protein [Pseudoalteromonas distincta]MDC3212952.1 hypothetical protein [Pseudoalteromonas distincta]
MIIPATQCGQHKINLMLIGNAFTAKELQFRVKKFTLALLNSAIAALGAIIKKGGLNSQRLTFSLQ